MAVDIKDILTRYVKNADYQRQRQDFPDYLKRL